MHTLPHDAMSEQALIGTLLLNPQAFELTEDLNAEDFFVKKHQYIFEAMNELLKEGKNVDLVTLRNKLKEKELLEKIGGYRALLMLSEIPVTTAFAFDYVDIIRKHARARKVVEGGRTLEGIGFKYHEDPDGATRTLESLMLELADPEKEKRGFLPMNSTLKGFLKELEDQKGEGGLKTGFPSLDEILMGFRPGQMIVLAARPSVGKSSFAINMATSIASAYQIPVGFISLEMGSNEILAKVISSVGKVPLRKLKTKEFADNDLRNLGKAVETTSRMPFHICDKAGLTLPDIRRLAIKLRMEHGLGLLMIDYLQLIRSYGKHSNMVHQVQEISMGVKVLARELEIPILILSQLSRDIEKRDNKEPKLSDLRDSGSIEQDADVVIFLDRDKDQNDSEASVYIKKNRGGELGKINLNWTGAYTQFWEKRDTG